MSSWQIMMAPRFWAAMGRTLIDNGGTAWAQDSVEDLSEAEKAAFLAARCAGSGDLGPLAWFAVRDYQMLPTVYRSKRARACQINFFSSSMPGR